MKVINHLQSERGQSIFEVLIAIAIASLIIGSAVTAIIISLRSGSSAVLSQRGYAIANGTLNNVRSFAESNWADLYALTKDDTTSYYMSIVATSSTSTTLGIANGTTTINFTSTSTGENVDYTSWFTIDDVSRGSSDWIAGSGTVDPTTHKIAAHTSWEVNGETKQIDLISYISKIRTNAVTFNSWAGSSGVTTPVTRTTQDYYSITNATITAEGSITY